MPINHDLYIKSISEDEFHSLDYKVMEIAFSIHNEMGRFWDEKIYQNELAYRCKKIGLGDASTEVPIEVLYKDFQKHYYIDLIINNSIIYEIKTTKALSGEHLKQTLNYLFLMGVQHGKLVNFHPPSVEYSFVSTKLKPENRFNFTIDEGEWKELDDDSIWLKKILINLLSEWGMFLEKKLFYDAIIHFHGDEEDIVKKIKVSNNSRILGKQKVHLLNSEVAFRISSITKNRTFYEQHLRRFIRFTSLKAIQWINFKQNEVVF
jgi:GxxExxY protein